MKGIIRYSIIFVIFLTTACGSNDRDRNKERESIYNAEISFKDSIYDFGKIKLRNEPYSYSFSLNNNGKVPAVVLHTIPSCKCTRVEYNKSPIPVGKSDSIYVYFDSKESGRGYFDKAIKIRINSPKIYTLRIRGVVE